MPWLQPLASLSRMASDLAVDRATPSPDQSRYIHMTSTRWRACCYIHVESDTSLYMFPFSSIASTVRERVFAKLLQKQVQWEPSTLDLFKPTVSAVYISMCFGFSAWRLCIRHLACIQMYVQWAYICSTLKVKWEHLSIKDTFSCFSIVHVLHYTTSTLYMYIPCLQRVFELPPPLLKSGHLF